MQTEENTSRPFPNPLPAQAVSHLQETIAGILVGGWDRANNARPLVHDVMCD